MDEENRDDPVGEEDMVTRHILRWEHKCPDEQGTQSNQDPLHILFYIFAVLSIII